MSIIINNDSAHSTSTYEAAFPMRVRPLQSMRLIVEVTKVSNSLFTN